MTPALRDQVRKRAGDRCKYCRLPQECTTLPHEADHIRSQKHRGSTILDNLCWACARCNDFKGSDVSSYDPVTGELVPLFNPRTCGMAILSGAAQRCWER
jgi:5-methylcytosine-specific restriction endonuclease McrA